jgi:hypothetical protein
VADRPSVLFFHVDNLGFGELSRYSGGPVQRHLDRSRGLVRSPRTRADQPAAPALVDGHPLQPAHRSVPRQRPARTIDPGRRPAGPPAEHIAADLAHRRAARSSGQARGRSQRAIWCGWCEPWARLATEFGWSRPRVSPPVGGGGRRCVRVESPIAWRPRHHRRRRRVCLVFLAGACRERWAGSDSGVSAAEGPPR